MPKAKKSLKPSATTIIPAWTSVTINQAVLANQPFVVQPFLPKKKALIVGIDDYAPVGPGGPDLHGCVNDAWDMANTMVSLGFIPANAANIHILTNAQAKKAKILAELSWLLKGAVKGDRLIFHYSGHGSQVPDLSGDEPEGWDETICPHDFASEGMIRDDDFRALFTPIPAGVNLEVILDSCHSGTGTRDLSAEPPMTIRFIAPELDEKTFLANYKQVPVRQFMHRASEKERQLVVVPGLNHVLWAGCKSNQTSGEGPIGGGPTRGYFTYWFCSELRKLGKLGTRKQLDAAIQPHFGPSQTPQLECDAPSATETVFT